VGLDSYPTNCSGNIILRDSNKIALMSKKKKKERNNNKIKRRRKGRQSSLFPA
jgi:hypothetical protein